MDFYSIVNSMIEKAPENISVTPAILEILVDEKYKKDLEKIEKEYFYYDKVKYYTPKGLKQEEFWAAVCYSRRIGCQHISFGEDYEFLFKETNYMHPLLHEFDMTLSNLQNAQMFISEKNKSYYLLSSIMEEAIASSQMEGAVTTRKVAKDMLRKQLKPKDKSEQMILNNYNTIHFLLEHKEENLSIELLLNIHHRITEGTLENKEAEGHLRLDDSIVVANGITGEISHEPPSYKEIEALLISLCAFANSEEPYIHPIIKAIIIHFMTSFIHPFVDGNGRTARSLFYWYMLKKGYPLTEFLSISRIIYKSKAQYERAFLYTECDNFDLNYFISYNLKVLHLALEEFKKYIDKKNSEIMGFLSLDRLNGINERQVRIINLFRKNPGSIFVSKDLETTLNVSVKTIRKDLETLVKLGILKTVSMNKRLVGYTRSGSFEDVIKSLGST